MSTRRSRMRKIVSIAVVLCLMMVGMLSTVGFAEVLLSEDFSSGTLSADVWNAFAIDDGNSKTTLEIISVDSREDVLYMTAEGAQRCAITTKQAFPTTDFMLSFDFMQPGDNYGDYQFFVKQFSEPGFVRYFHLEGLFPKVIGIYDRMLVYTRDESKGWGIRWEATETFPEQWYRITVKNVDKKTTITIKDLESGEILAESPEFGISADAATGQIRFAVQALNGGYRSAMIDNIEIVALN